MDMAVMRKWTIALASLTVVCTGQAQLFNHESLGGAVLGGIVGGVIGHNHHRQTAEGAAIGAGAGLLLGNIVHQSRKEYAPYQAQAQPAYHPPVTVYQAQPLYPRPNYAASGAILGGIAGGVIGHNHHRQTAEGIAIGAGTGLLLGTLAEREARRQEQTQWSAANVAAPTPVAAAPPPAVPPPAPAASSEPPASPATPVVAQPATTPPPPTPMSGANSLFGR